MTTGKRWLVSGGVLMALVSVLAVSFVLRPLSYADAVLRLHLWRAGVKSHDVTVNGLKLRYFEATPPSGAGASTPLVLVHGLGARGEDWAPLLPGLARAGFHVYAPDLPGYGRSAQPVDASYSIAYEEEAVQGFMQAMHLPHADVAGWSMGGWIAMRLTADHPQLVDRLVLYDSAGVYFPLDYSPSLFTPNNPEELDTLLRRLTPKRMTMPGFVARDFLRRSAQNAWVIRRSVAGMTSGRDLMEFRLGEIHRPTAVMWGTEDVLIPPSAGRKIARGIRGAVFIPLTGCGHLAPAECASQALPATISFLRQGTPTQH